MIDGRPARARTITDNVLFLILCSWRLSHIAFCHGCCLFALNAYAVIDFERDAKRILVKKSCLEEAMIRNKMFGMILTIIYEIHSPIVKYLEV